MKKIIASLLIACCFCLPTRAQSYEVQQLLLDVSKLAYLKQILSDMKTGYEIVSKGYSTIRDISSGNFSLHKTFLDGLLSVSPSVQKYKKIAGIVDFELSLVKEYKSAFGRFKQSGNFTDNEITYIGNVYSNLFNESVKNLDDLTNIITAGLLRMTDEERLSAIDKIYADMQDKLVFLRHFNGQTGLLGLQREKEQRDINGLKKIYSPD